jgi:hypothetical protein
MKRIRTLGLAIRELKSRRGYETDKATKIARRYVKFLQAVGELE